MWDLCIIGAGISGLATALHPEGAKQVIALPPKMEGDGGESLYLSPLPSPSGLVGT